MRNWYSPALRTHACSTNNLSGMETRPTGAMSFQISAQDPIQLFSLPISAEAKWGGATPAPLALFPKGMLPFDKFRASAILFGEETEESKKPVSICVHQQKYIISISVFICG
jgi:hypothetical protein